MTPSLFDAVNNKSVVDEWSYSSALGPTETEKRLSKHWDSFITLDDIESIARAGLNHVRIPIGYWAFEVRPGEPYVSGQLPYLIKALGWCKQNGVRVIVDLHGAPGSQNGFDNSGHKGPVEWASPSNVDRTLKVLKTLFDELARDEWDNVVTAFQALNEPAGYISSEFLETYRKFLQDGYDLLRPPRSSSPSLKFNIHDAFQSLPSWSSSPFLADNKKYHSISLDTHIYTIFDDAGVAMSLDKRVKKICAKGKMLKEVGKGAGLIVGEWSPAITDCAENLNGQGTGSRYDGSFPKSSRVGSCSGMSGDGSNFSESYKESLRRFWEVQVSTYEASTNGWVMWSWKTENADDWSWQAGLNGGWIPEDLTERKFGDQCS
ncbi:exo-beta-1,3-glucanase [Meredithblackwellia eburnea MCA 4105]